MKKFDERVFTEVGIKKEMFLDESNYIIIKTYLIGLDSADEWIKSEQFGFLDQSILNYFNSDVI